MERDVLAKFQDQRFAGERGARIPTKLETTEPTLQQKFKFFSLFIISFQYVILTIQHYDISLIGRGIIVDFNNEFLVVS